MGDWTASCLLSFEGPGVRVGWLLVEAVEREEANLRRLEARSSRGSRTKTRSQRVRGLGKRVNIVTPLAVPPACILVCS